MMECTRFRERRALSAPPPVWQSRAAVAALLAAAFAAPALAVPGGDLGTLPQGRYACEVPDPAGVTRGTAREEEDFTIVNASSYRARGVIGSYLRTGDSVALTSGPRDGERYRLVSSGTLQRLDASGAATVLRCVRVTRNTR